MEKDIKIFLDDIREDIHELKELQKIVIEQNQEIALLRQEMHSSNEKHNEGRKVIHKRMDTHAKIGIWLGASMFTAMAGVILTLVEKIMG